MNIGAEILTFLLSIVASYTSYTPLSSEQLPSIVSLSKEDLSRELCPDDPKNCQNMAAVYDTCKKRILIRDDLDMNNDSDNSFLLHELIHAHQHATKGDLIYSNCKNFYETEKEAYDIQNKYLKRQGQFLRAGDYWLNHFQCNEEELKKENICP